MLKITIGLSLSFFLLGIIISCSKLKNDRNISIKITIPKSELINKKGKYFYLYDIAAKKNIDSQLIISENTIFSLVADSAFIPHMVCVKEIDTFKGNLFPRVVGFMNPFRKNTVNSLFFLDIGNTTIKTYSHGSGDTTKFAFSGSKQNLPYLKEINLSYPDNRFDNRKSIVENNIRIIKAYPYSVFLLTELFIYKQFFQDDELKKQLSVFDNDLKFTQLFSNFNAYFKLSSSYDEAYPYNLIFETPKSKQERIGNPKGKLSLFIFWASWCGPCRTEIPKIKSLYEKYHDKGLSITSISIDTEKENWNKALIEEKMSWRQLISTDSSKRILDINYNISAIPKAYLYDQNKRLIAKFEGNDSSVIKKIISLLGTPKSY